MKTQEDQLMDAGSQPDPKPAPVYERPRLILMGNFNDLLASTGTQNDDSGPCDGSRVFNPECV